MRKYSMKTTLQISNLTFELRRYPIRENETLQAWDSADEYLIDHLNENHSRLDYPLDCHFLIMNDSFGALSCWAIQNGHRVTSVNDSLLSQQNIKHNLAANNLTGASLLSSLDNIPDDIDVVVIKLPLNNRLLVWQLQQLAHCSSKNFSVISGAKTKDVHSSTLKLFEKHLGQPHTSLAKKKSRLIFCQKEIHQDTLPAPTTRFDVPEFQLNLENHANVFSAQCLDIAAYLMLKHIPSNPDIKHIIDLGCGNGVLSVQAARLNPQANITAIDESHMAVASASCNLLAHGIHADKIHCMTNNALEGFTNNSADLILCNPPFHQLNAVTDHIAWKMFCDAKRVIEPQGRILVIGNRHLGYHTKLKRLFGNANTVASNKKFVILEAIKHPDPCRDANS